MRLAALNPSPMGVELISLSSSAKQQLWKIRMGRPNHRAAFLFADLITLRTLPTHQKCLENKDTSALE